MEKSIENGGLTEHTSMFGLLECGYSVVAMIEALEDRKVRMLDSFGRNNIVPRTEDVQEIRAALLEYADFDDERTRAGAAQSDRCLKYFKSFQGFVCGGPVDTPRTPVLGRVMLTDMQQGDKIPRSSVSDAARTLVNVGGKAADRIRAEELATPYALEGQLQHNVVTDILWKMEEPDGTRLLKTLAKSGVRKVVKDVYEKHGLQRLIKGHRTRPTNGEVL